MREELKKLNQLRRMFTATIGRFGRRNVNHLNKNIVWTILLKNITDKDGNIIADHLWINLNKEFDKLNIREGDRIKFSAKIIEYYKKSNSLKKKKDYKIDKLLNIKKLNDTNDDTKI